MLKTTTPPPEPDTRLVSPREAGDDVALDITLRPRTLAEFIGQEKIKQSLAIFLQAAKSRGETIDHVLLYGPPGIGKTSLANIIAREMGASIKTTSGPAIERAGDLASLLTNLEAGDVLFIDEIHRLPRAVEEVLYPAMEDWSLDIILGKGPGARSVKLDLPRFTLIGATTRYAALSSPLRDRFGSVYRLDFYEPEEIASIIERSGRILGSIIDAESAQVIALRSRRTPRVANRLLKRARDYAQVKGDGTITPSAAREALAMLAIDDLGLDDNDRRILNVLIEKFNGGPVGVSTLAASTSEEIDTIEDVYEPYLMRVGLLARTPKGRVATPRAYEHLGKTPPQKSLL